MKTFKSFIFTILAAAVAVMIVLLATGAVNFEASSFWTSLGIALFYSAAFALVNKGFFSWLGRTFSWEEQPKTRFALGAIGSVLLNLLTFGLCRFVVQVWLLDQYPASDFFHHQNFIYYIFPLMLAAIIALGFHAFYFYKTIQDERMKQQQIIAAQAEARFDALKSQLDPHFLFNSLNVLNSLIDEQPEKAQDFTTSLSEVYRYVLEQSRRKRVSIADEIEFAKLYMSLIQMRFENGIELRIEKGLENDKRKILPLSLQLLLENAVKHNAASSEKPLKILIVSENNQLCVKNSLSPKTQLTKHTGFGLKNIEERYSLLTDQQVKIEQTETEFNVGIPVFE